MLIPRKPGIYISRRFRKGLIGGLLGGHSTGESAITYEKGNIKLAFVPHMTSYRCITCTSPQVNKCSKPIHSSHNKDW